MGTVMGLYRPWDPEQWGPYAWRVLHSLATVTSQDQLEAVLSTFALAVPCDACRTHLSRMIATRRIPRDTVRFLFDLHNEVNARLKKPILGRVPRYAAPQFSSTFCADLDNLVQRMRSRRGPNEIGAFLLAVQKVLVPFSCQKK